MPTLEEKIEELQEEQQKALKELEAAQLKGNELNALIQRQTGAIRVLLDLKAEQSESLRQDVPNGEIETVLSTQERLTIVNLNIKNLVSKVVSKVGSRKLAVVSAMTAATATGTLEVTWPMASVMCVYLIAQGAKDVIEAKQN